MEAGVPSLAVILRLRILLLILLVFLLDLPRRVGLSWVAGRATRVPRCMGIGQIRRIGRIGEWPLQTQCAPEAALISSHADTTLLVLLFFVEEGVG